MNFPCKNCKDRTIEPNCHMTCEKYKQAKEESAKEWTERHKDTTNNYYTFDKIAEWNKKRSRR